MNNKIFGTIIGLVAIIAVIWCGYSSWQSYRPNTHGSRQAIFLADGQIYFGYASSLRNQVVVVKDIYYLQAVQPLQSTDSKTPASATQQVNIIKLGSEIQGPTDQMKINRDNIKFIEDMKSDSEVNQKITDYLKTKK